MPCSPSQAASECDLNAQACAQLEVVSPSGVCRGGTSGGQVKLSRKNDPGAEPTRSHPDAEKRPAQGAVTEVPVDVPSLALRVNELRRWMGPRQASCRGSARHLHPLPFTSTALAGARLAFHAQFGRCAWHPTNAVGYRGNPMSRDTSGSAFPLALGWIETDQNNGNQKTVDVRDVEHGLSVRNYFAAKAMNGYLANPWQAKELDDTGDSSGEQMRIVAEISYAMADAMLAARVKP